MKKAVICLFLALFLVGCGASRVLVKHDSCQPEPGKSGLDNCEKARDL